MHNLNVHLKTELRAFTSAQAWLRVFRLPLMRLTLIRSEGIWPVLKRGVLPTSPSPASVT